MARLKSRTGCLTCLARRKKCDEATPICNHCQRLGLACIGREKAPKGTVTLTNLKARKQSISPAISPGYPAFQSDLEKHLSILSPTVLQPMISRMAGPQFRNMTLFGHFCTESSLVRDAIVAFSSYGRESMTKDSYQVSLRSYQRCIGKLKQTRAYEVRDVDEGDYALTAILFLGLLEALTLGDPSNSVTHFEVCRKLLMHRLSKPEMAFRNPDLTNLYRIIAECITYNLATLSPFHANIAHAAGDWGTSFDCLFPEDDDRLSPFFGGVHEIYHVMFRTNVLLRRSRSWGQEVDEGELNSLWQRLDRLENKIPTLYKHHDESTETTDLYRAKYRIHILALRIHLTKISRTSAAPSDRDVKLHFTRAIEVMKQQDIREPFNPSLRWPLTIIACAADTDSDFIFMNQLMQEIEQIVDVANARQMASAREALWNFRDGTVDDHAEDLTNSLDFLLEPRRLYNVKRPSDTHRVEELDVDVA